MGIVGRFGIGQTPGKRLTEDRGIFLCTPRTKLSTLPSSEIARLLLSVRKAVGQNCPATRLCREQNPVVRSWHRPCSVPSERTTAVVKTTAAGRLRPNLK